jgi:shikimate kinase
MRLRSEPVLIGPAFVGKTTIGALLAERLGLAFVDLDEVGDEYYRAAGMSLADFRAEIETRGYSRAHRWWQPARVAGVQGVLANHPRSVVALGAGHTHYEDEAYFHIVREALAPFVNVLLLLPEADVDRSVEILRHRALAGSDHTWFHDGRDWLREWCESAQNVALSTHTVCTADRAADETADHIVWLVGGR